MMTLSLVTPSWAAGRSTVATRGENNGITWEKVDNIKLPTKENAAVADETQQYADTDVVRVSIVLSRQRSVWPDREDRERQGRQAGPDRDPL